MSGTTEHTDVTMPGAESLSCDEQFALAQKIAANIGYMLTEAPSFDEEERQPLTFGYTNWRGEFSIRQAVPMRVRFGATDWHQEPQWLLTAWDVEKNAERDFAMRDMVPPARPSLSGNGEAEPVAVKPLEWVHRIEGGAFLGKSSLGPDYSFFKAGNGEYICATVALPTDPALLSVEAAKAAAQADYAQRIRSALTPPAAAKDDTSRREDTALPTCGLCGEPMPPGEEMFKFHGYSGPCPSKEMHSYVGEHGATIIHDGKPVEPIEVTPDAKDKRIAELEEERDELKEERDEAYQEGYDEGASNWRGVKAQLWNAMVHWLSLRHGLDHDGDGYTVDDLLDALATVERDYKHAHELLRRNSVRLKEAETQLSALNAKESGNAELIEALRWYASQVRDCHKITSEGNTARHALDADGGKRAVAALDSLNKEEGNV